MMSPGGCAGARRPAGPLLPPVRTTGGSTVLKRLIGGRRRKLALVIASCAAVVTGIAVTPVLGATAQAAASFKVLAFYNGTCDAAHIDFDKAWFPQAGAQYGFTWEATTNWSLLNAGNLAQYKV